MNICNHCGQRIIEDHKEVLNKMKLTMLQKAAEYVISTMKNDFKVADFAPEDQFKMYNNFQKLRYHGLITPVRDGMNQRIRGRWLITRNAWSFLRGEISLSKYVLVKNNRITSHSDQEVFVKDIWYGAQEIQTSFEYFDEFGQPIGWKPIQRNFNQQMSLV